jgi:hypothetical protein
MIPRPIDLLRDALAAARIALRLLEPDEVPPRVRRVRAYSSGALPPPLAKSLLDELDDNEFLRLKALEAWEGDPPGAGRARAGYAFLQRGQSWMSVVVEEAIALGQHHGSAADEAIALERDALAAELVAVREQRLRERDEAQRTQRELRETLDAERAPGRSDRQAEQRAIARLVGERAGWEATEAGLRAELGVQRDEVARLQEAARLERRARAELAAAVDDQSSAPFPTEPMALARHLDDLAAHAAALVERPHPAAMAPEEVECPPIDPTVLPDSAVAIDWLVREWPGPILVDGYNLGFLIGTLEPASARLRALEVARRLAGMARSSLVTVVFDSEIDHGHSGSRTGNLEVVFTAGETADDAIVARCAATDCAVVITNDRELRERCQAAGCKTMWVDALVEWSRRR